MATLRDIIKKIYQLKCTQLKVWKKIWDALKTNVHNTNNLQVLKIYNAVLKFIISWESVDAFTSENERTLEDLLVTIGSDPSLNLDEQFDENFSIQLVELIKEKLEVNFLFFMMFK